MGDKTRAEQREDGGSRFMDLNEIADDLQVSYSVVHTWVEEKRLPAVKVGRLIRVQRKAYEEFLLENSTV